MAAASAASLALLAGLRNDVGYFFAPAQPTHVGDVLELEPSTLIPNTFVTIAGTPMASTQVSYARAFGERYAVFALAGQRRVLVQVPADDHFEVRTSARREFSGRLVRVSDLGGRFSAVRRHYERMQVPVTGETFVLLADEPPGSYGWAIGLAALCLVFVLLNLFLLLRWFRPIRLK